MQISLNGVAGESSVLVSRIVNQRVNGRNVTDGVPGQPFKDNADPYIIYDQTVSRDGNIHTNHALRVRSLSTFSIRMFRSPSA